MLAEILKAFRETREPLDLNELSRRLGIERSALEGMLELLVRQGKLRETNPGSVDCAYCSNMTCTQCQSPKGTRAQGSPMGKFYELTDKAG